MPGEPGERHQRGVHRRLGYDSHLLSLFAPITLSSVGFTCVNPGTQHMRWLLNFGDCCCVKLDVLFGAHGVVGKGSKCLILSIGYELMVMVVKSIRGCGL